MTAELAGRGNATTDLERLPQGPHQNSRRRTSRIPGFPPTTHGLSLRLWAAAILAILGGFIVLYSGFEAGGLLPGLLSYAQGNVPPYLGAPERTALRAALELLSILVTLGGATILLGALLLLARWVRSGRFLIFLGGGVGVLGLLLLLGYSLATSGMAAVTQHFDYWVGIVLASIAAGVAKGA